MVRSILEYACPVWHTMLPKCLGDKIEKVQKRAFRIIYPTRDYEYALNIAQCKRLDDRRQELCTKTFKKICRTERFKTSFIPAMTANFNSK
jgi:hypothetical protein